MVVINTDKIVFSPKILKEYEEAKQVIKPDLILMNLFLNAANKKYAAGTSWDIQKKFGKLADKLGQTGDLELSDEQFDFLLETIRDTQVAPNIVIPPVVEYLELVKMEISKAK